MRHEILCDRRLVLEDGLGKAYIENIAAAQRIMLRESGGTHGFSVEFCEGPGLTRRGWASGARCKRRIP